MSTNKEQVIAYILKLIAASDKKLVSKTVEAFSGDVSKSSVYNYLAELSSAGIVKKNGSSYFLVDESFSFVYCNDGSLGEDRIFSKDIEPILHGYEKNVFSAWRYAFTEMMNNAIEHSSAEKISVLVKKNALRTTVEIADNGVGIFRNIENYMRNERSEELSLKECASLLFSGKFTTASSMHSGEGIFFTSHLMDSFHIFSDGIIFTRNNFSDTTTPAKANEGTVVVMSLDNRSNKTAREVFDRFSNVDDGFIKTQIPIAQVFSGSGPVSRSEARRLGELVSKFLDVELDFFGVEEVGQGFVHEMFIVWQNRNPNVKITVLNAEEAVDRMIRRVMNTK